MAVKSALIQTTSTAGWNYVKQIANNVVNTAIQDALDELDRDTGEAKRLKAAALKKGFNDLFNAIESTKDLNFQPEDNGFGELETE